VRRYLFVLITCILMLCSYELGSQIRAYSDQGILERAETQIINSKRQLELTSFIGCMYAIDSDVMRFINRPNVELLISANHKISVCGKIIDSVGTSVLNNNDTTDESLSQALLFFDGYKKTVREILSRQAVLHILYDSLPTPDEKIHEEIRNLENQQQRQIHEVHQFVFKISYLTLLAW
jgi:hypothetical protein